jgi:predicted GNAT superfamily acetyltransferase
MVNRVELNGRGLVVPPADFERVNVRFALVEIPASIQAVKKLDMGLAAAWRETTRALFEHYFDSNYVVTDFVRFEDSAGRMHNYYVLTRGGI